MSARNMRPGWVDKWAVGQPGLHCEAQKLKQRSSKISQLGKVPSAGPDHLVQSQGLHSSGEEPTPTGCPLTSTWELWHIYQEINKQTKTSRYN